MRFERGAGRRRACENPLLAGSLWPVLGSTWGRACASAPCSGAAWERLRCRSASEPIEHRFLAKKRFPRADADPGTATRYDHLPERASALRRVAKQLHRPRAGAESEL